MMFIVWFRLLALLFGILCLFSGSTVNIRNRVYTIGENPNYSLCSSSATVFYSSSRKIIDYPPSGSTNEMEITDICMGYYFFSVFLMENGDVYGSGVKSYLGYEGDSTTTAEPILINFPNTQKFESLYCTPHFFMGCSRGKDECYGLGDNSFCQYAGCESSVKKIHYSPISIFTAPFETENIKAVQVFAFFAISLTVVKDTTNNLVSGIYFTGMNNGNYFLPSGGSPQGWVSLSSSSLINGLSDRTDESPILFAEAVFTFTLFFVTKDQRIYFIGKTDYSSCTDTFTESTVTSITELPSSCTSDGYANEFLGKEIEQFSCSSACCLVITKDGGFYSWGSSITDGSDYRYLGRSSSISNKAAHSIDTTFLSSITGNFAVKQVTQPSDFTLFVLFDEDKGYDRVFAFGNDRDMKFYFRGQTTFYSTVEILLHDDYELTKDVFLSKGRECSGIFVLTSSKCWGSYNYDPDVECIEGYCTNTDECTCIDDSKTWGTYCNETKCFGILATDNSTCSGKGTCIAYDTCDCDFKQSGGGVFDNCTTAVCFGIEASDPSVCSGNGKCFGENDCKCDDDSFGEQCEDQNNSVAALYIGGSFAAVGVFFFFFLCCALSLLLFFVCAGAVAIFLLNRRNKRKMKKFSKIKNVDLILEEQKLEERVDIAHLRINKELFQIDMKEIRLKKVIGEGGSNSIVYLVLWHERDAAFKCFRTRMICSEQQNFDEFEREVAILGSISHPNIIRYYGACLDPSRTGFVMEYCPNGDLSYYITIKKNKDELFEVSEKARILFEIASAMDFLHSKSIIHRDLKPENVLLDSTLNCKLMDFGASKFEKKTQDVQMTKGVGTSYFMSPEIVSGNEYTKKVDVFSFGILMYVVLMEELNPFKEFNSINVEYKVANDPSFRPKFFENEKKISSDFKELCRNCWDHDPKNRKSFGEILKILKENDFLFHSTTAKEKMFFKNQQGEKREKKDERYTRNKKYDDDDEKEEEEERIEELEKKVKFLSMEKENQRKEISFLKERILRLEKENKELRESKHDISATNELMMKMKMKSAPPSPPIPIQRKSHGDSASSSFSPTKTAPPLPPKRNSSTTSSTCNDSTSGSSERRNKMAPVLPSTRKQY